MLRLMTVAVLTGLLALIPAAKAEVTVNISEGVLKPTPLAIPTFEVSGGADSQLAAEITEVVQNDLISTGLFTITPESAHIQRDLSIDTQPRFADWKIIQTDALVVGEVDTVTVEGVEFIRASVRLWDVYGEEVMRLEGQAGRRFTAKPEDWRRIAHKIADTIYSRLTGEDPYFDTRIVYIAETGPKDARKTRLAIMDSDGANVKYLTTDNNLVLSPRFSPSNQQITYMSYENQEPRVYLFDIQNGRQEVLGDIKTFAPRFSRDGESVLMTKANNGNSDIYIRDLVTQEMRRLTDNPNIDVSPSMSPDGRQVVFTSDRGGSPQLYIMNVDGSPLTCPSGGRDTVCRITFGSGAYSAPVWSPRGDLIAFTKQLRGKFHIGVIGTDGEGERLLTESYLDEGPAWSPNGRVIIFAREPYAGGPRKLWSVDLTGRNLRQVPTPTEASDPAWSPLLN
ncbi:Tol-Pal system beta propeller repeat protein TolB [Henriciella aquimarina]|uniref:Tol-Pal system beta propeller repeat protein TolB n=1 Tax=Henriciella aquimarina TaxID=545261 RepID=UPI0009FFC508|nr:Tol-Pal system beta propeller repeat protein TolB [Henriciella aquimarina]